MTTPTPRTDAVRDWNARCESQPDDKIVTHGDLLAFAHDESDELRALCIQLERALAAANAENAAQREAIAEQCTRLNELMVGADDGTTPVIRRIGALKEQLALAHDAINDALPWMIKLGDYIGNGTQADPMGRCNAILKMRIAVEKRDD